eukprot:scaffold20945_cov33-Tisochrysis_lutea.AAC.2
MIRGVMRAPSKGQERCIWRELSTTRQAEDPATNGCNLVPKRSLALVYVRACLENARDGEREARRELHNLRTRASNGDQLVRCAPVSFCNAKSSEVAKISSQAQSFTVPPGQAGSSSPKRSPTSMQAAQGCTWSSMSSRRHDARPPAAVIAATVIRCSAVESST